MISVSQLGQRLSLEAIIANQLVGAQVSLYVNNFSPTYLAELTDYVEASFPGYTPQGASGWSAPTNVGMAARTTASDITWTASATVTPSVEVYGYFVVNSDGDYIYGERFGNGPFTMTNTGDSITLTPRFSAIAEL